jgi:hypothetical protein
VTVTSTAQARVRELIDRIRNLPQEIILVLDLDGFNPEQTSLARVVDAPAAYISGAPKDMRRAAIMGVFDVCVATSALIVFALPMALIALLVRLDSAGPVFFRQKRHGFNNEIIRVWKFRTMRQEDEGGSQTRRREASSARQSPTIRASRALAASCAPAASMNFAAGERAGWRDVDRRPAPTCRGHDGRLDRSDAYGRRLCPSPSHEAGHDRMGTDQRLARTLRHAGGSARARAARHGIRTPRLGVAGCVHRAYDRAAPAGRQAEADADAVL